MNPKKKEMKVLTFIVIFSIIDKRIILENMRKI